MSRSTQNLKIRITHDNSLTFYSDQHEHLRIDFMRTLRIPDDGKDYPLPPGFDKFPMRRVSDYLGTVPKKWLDSAATSVFIPMYQREAMWLSFSGQPTALKVCAGRINAVSGEPWTEELQDLEEGEDYLVAPRQPWLDGFNTGDGSIRQFVAMPLGMGYTVEGQVTGKEEHGGLQFTAYPAKEGLIQQWHRSSYGSSYHHPEVPHLGDPAMKRILERLTETGQLKPEEKDALLNKSGPTSGSLFERFEKADLFKDPEGIVLEIGSELFGLAAVDMKNADPQLCRYIPEDLARRYGVVPVEELASNVLVLAMVDPLDVIAVDDIQLITGYNVIPAMATRTAVREAINQTYGVTDLVEVEETVKDISAQDFGFSEMGLAAGGTMKQKVMKDPYGIETWEIDAGISVQVHLVDIKTWCQITGEQPPKTPVNAALYTKMGYPWFDLYEEHLTDRKSSEILKSVLSVSQMDAQKEVVGMDNSPVWIPKNQVVTYYSSSKKIGKG